MPLCVHLSNRLEELAAGLAEVAGRPLASPFTAETIVVQSKGMQRWVAMELAGRFGVWANARYPFPNAIAWQLLRAALPDLPENSPFAPETMTWRIMALLPDLLGQAPFAPLRRYLESDPDGLKRYQLAGRIADTFDQYTLFRPELLLDWEDGADGEWQAGLWRRLATAGDGLHRGRLRLEFRRRLAAGLFRGEGCPERISVFGISCLPAFHLDLLTAAARFAEVHLFLLSPSREYWGDIVSAREIARRPAEERPYLSEGHPLLASLGRLGRDFFEMIAGADELLPAQRDRYRDPGDRTLLSALQSDILHLRGAGEEKGRGGGDRSIQVHVCHSPMREIEVLHDQLLALLEEIPGLTPRQIVVMTPDIESYAPYIAAVFEGVQEPARRIPYAIADRSLAAEGEIARVLLGLLDLAGSRFPVSRVLDLLATGPVARRFALAEGEFDSVVDWLRRTRVRWGLDEADRARHGLPPFRENSWRAGLDRLLLGYAMPEVEGELFHDLLPFDAVEGENAQALGRFAEFVSRLGEAADDLARPRPLAAWQAACRSLLDGFVAADDEGARELAAVAEAVDDLGRLGGEAEFSGPVDLAVIRAWLSSRLGGQEKGQGFLTGGVTFCAMLPMRSIPFRVVALVGLNDGSFPRQDRPPEFDLIARHPRRGDRSLRDEDRYLFLEALLSARDVFYLSYVGRSIKDNSEIPPSVLVSEFLDALAGRFSTRDPDGNELLAVRHPLQPFSPSYFDGAPGLFSFAEENCRALRQRGRGEASGPFMTVPLPAPAPAEVELEELLAFYAHPVRFFLTRRLGLRLEEAEAAMAEREPFGLDPLEAFGLRQELAERVLRGGSAAALLPVFRARGVLPPGRHGEALFADLRRQAEEFAAAVAAAAAAPPLPPLEVSLDCGGVRLAGRLDGVRPDALVRWRCGRRRGRDSVRAWIEHLALGAAAPPDHPRRTRLVTRDGALDLAPVADPLARLGEFLACYRRGQELPLRFFPETSLAFAESGGDPGKARAAWEGSDHQRGEGEDRYLRLCFGRDDPFSGEFAEVALTLLGPLVRQ